MRAHALLAAAFMLGPGAGAAGASDGDLGPVSQITDPRITEASGMVVSTRSPGLAYVVNDSGNDPIVFSVRIATGEVVGTTTLTTVTTGAPVDVEALAIDARGRLLVADIGDNDSDRDEVALLALPQPGTGTDNVTPASYRVRYADGPADAEALVADPDTGRLAIVTKGLEGGRVLRLPRELPETGVAVARPLDVRAPRLVTDGSALPDGSGAVLRSYGAAYVFSWPDWRRVGRRELPSTQQGETLAVESGGRTALVGSEGSPSPLIRVALPAEALAELETGEQPERVDSAGQLDADLTADDPPAQAVWAPWLYAGGAAVGLGVGVLVVWRLRRRGDAYG